ncbi:MAG TPA: efflux RND transporter periplasmic adaptor subunit [Vicinamibacterales bacterium]|nr:efflux RND transporter periplasmic adaptor subunit [Vicinamibacterales bacterium]
MEFDTPRFLAMALTFTAAASSAACSQPAETKAPPPPEVYVASVVQKDVPEYLELVGQTNGFQDVEIRARVEGFLDTMNFVDGSFVRKGDLLYQIDRRPLQATVDPALAEKATAEARLNKSTNDVNRCTPLVVKQAVSRQELDDAKSAHQASTAQVEAAAAAVEKAKLDLGYTTVRSAINGLVGTTRVKPATSSAKANRRFSPRCRKSIRFCFASVSPRPRCFASKNATSDEERCRR